VSAKKSALGKGLDALLGGDDDFDVFNGDEEARKEAGIVEIPLDLIKANPEQPRKHFSQELLLELADSIKSQGIISPILVKPSGDEYIIVAGERRYRASRLAGKESIPVIIRDFTEEETLEIALIENIQRQDLSPMEEAKAYRHMMEKLDMTQQEVADKVGKKRSTVANSLRLLNLTEEVQESLEKGEISAGHARSLLSLMNPSDQTLLHQRIVEQGLSVRETERQASQLNQGNKSTKTAEKPKETEPLSKDPHVRDIEQNFIDRLGTKVKLKGSLHKGKIEIDYHSGDDLERLMDLILEK